MPKTKDQPSPMPTRKVMIGGIASVLTAIVVSLLYRYVGVELAPDEAAALAAVVYGAASYMVPEWDR
jgi:hypothetical protein